MTDPYGSAPPSGIPYVPSGQPAMPPGLPAVPPPYSAPVLVNVPAGAGTQAQHVLIAPLPGTPFGVALVQVPPVTFGPAIGSMVAGIGSIVVATITGCFGVSTAGPLVDGAFAILALLLGGAAIGTGVASMRTIRRSAGELTGRGMARAGLVCGIVGAALAVLAFLVGVLTAASR
jgi:hypothetical protein